MKIEIDLNEVFEEDGYVETLEESVKRQVLTQLTATIKKGIGRQIEQETAKIINEQLAAQVEKRMPNLVEEVLTAEYYPVDRWGGLSTKEPTTFRKELVKQIHEQMQYKPRTYSSEENVFTKAVKDVVQSEVSEFKKEFGKIVNATVVTQTLQFATQELAKRLGIALPKK